MLYDDIFDDKFLDLYIYRKKNTYEIEYFLYVVEVLINGI